MSNNKEYQKKYRAENQEKLKEHQKKYRAENQEKLKIYQKQYRAENKNSISKTTEGYKEKLKEYQKKYRVENKEKIKIYRYCYRERNKNNISKTSKKYRENNKKSIQKFNQKYSKRPEVIKRENKRIQLKRDTDPIFRLNNSLSSGIRLSLRFNNLSKNRRHWENIVGYTIQELKEHLEKLFKIGMSWDNYGKKGWHIDHVIPKVFFKYKNTNDTEFKYCWSLDNLQPLWENDNYVKNDKITIHGKEINSRY